MQPSNAKPGTDYLAIGHICDEYKTEERRRGDVGPYRRCGKNVAAASGWDDRAFCAGRANGSGRHEGYPGRV